MSMDIECHGGRVDNYSLIIITIIIIITIMLTSLLISAHFELKLRLWKKDKGKLRFIVLYIHCESLIIIITKGHSKKQEITHVCM